MADISGRLAEIGGGEWGEDLAEFVGFYTPHEDLAKEHHTGTFESHSDGAPHDQCAPYKEERDDFIEEMKMVVQRIALLSLEGNDPFGWLGKIEQYFTLHGTPPYHHMKIAHIYMDGPSIHWFYLINTKIPNIPWDRFTEELIKCYSARKAMNPFELLIPLKQDHQPIDLYIEILLAQIGAFLGEQCSEYFLNGLRDEVKKRVRRAVLGISSYSITT